MDKIETGVDRLVELISSEKRISVDDAAKKLGISKIVIQEWADLLEEEKIISIDYKFSKMFLVERKLTQTEVKEKEKEYSSEKDAFVRKVESSIKSLEHDSLGLEKIKKEFEIIKGSIGQEMAKVENEVKELEKYEYLKKNLDKDIEKQVNEFHTILDKAHSDIEKEEKKHQEFLQELEIEKREMQVKEHRLKSLEEKEESIVSRVSEIMSALKDVNKIISGEKVSITESEKRVSALSKAVKEIEDNIEKKKDVIQPMLDKAKKHEEQILKLQDQILYKAREKTQAIKAQVETSVKASSNFQQFFDKKNEVDKLIKQIEAEKKELETAYLTLEKKATAFDLTTKSNTVRSHIKNMEKDLNEVNKKKSKIREDLEKLIKLVKG